MYMPNIFISRPSQFTAAGAGKQTMPYSAISTKIPRELHRDWRTQIRWITPNAIKNNLLVL